MENETKIFKKLLLYILLFPLIITVFDLVLSTLGVEIGFWLAMSVFIAANLVVSIPVDFLTKLFMKKKGIIKLNYFLEIAQFVITFYFKIWFALWMFSIIGVESSRGAVLFAFLATDALIRVFGEPFLALIKHLKKGFRGKGSESQVG
jgi:hypothetical protein